MPIRDLSHLQPASRAVADDYLTQVRTALSGAEPGLVESMLDDLSTHLADTLSVTSRPEDVQELCGVLGSPTEYGNALVSGSDRARTSGTLWGMPYDLRPPNAARIAERWWNPRDTRLFPPRVFGLGWTVNFGAIAVRLRLIEPDAEDDSFALVDDRAFLAALAVPLLFTAGMLISYLVLRDALPVELPVHWDIRGRVDDVAPQRLATASLFLFAMLPTLWALWTVLVRRTPAARGAALGFATLMSGLSASVWFLTLLSLDGGVDPWAPPVIISMALVLTFVILLLLSRSGRAREIARDHNMSASHTELGDSGEERTLK